MQRMISKGNLSLSITGVIFLIVGVVLFIIGGAFGVYSYNFAQKANIVDAKIMKIDSYDDHDNDLQGRVEVQYEVDGKIYEKVLHSYSSSWYEGKTIELYCNKDNPKDVRPKSLIYLVTIILSGIGAIFLIIGICFKVKVAKTKDKIQWLLDNGTRSYGELTSFECNRHVRVNKRFPYYFICTVRNEYTGNKVNYKCEPIWVRPQVFVKQNYEYHFAKYVGKQVVVYVNPNKPKQYYVDFDMDEIVRCNIDM